MTDDAVTSGLSRERVERFVRDYRDNRARAATLEAAFRRVGAFSVSDDVREDASFGVHRLLRIEPLQDRSNWAEYRAWEFAVAQQRYLIDRILGERLADLESSGSSGHSWPAIRYAIDTMRMSGASLILFQGDIEADLISAIYKSETGPWALGEAIAGMPFLIGAVDGIPCIRSSRLGGQLRVYVLDLQRFGRLTQFRPTPTDEKTSIRIEAVTEERRYQILSESKDRWNRDPGGPKSDLEWLLSLRDKAEIWLYESAELSIVDTSPAAVVAIEIDDDRPTS